MLYIKSTPIPSFQSLVLYSIELENTSYYPLTPLSQVLGYATPHSLIQSIPSLEKISIDELYSLYLIHEQEFNSYQPVSFKQFKENMPLIFKPYWFTTLHGIEVILSKNTFTIPWLKEEIANMLDIVPISKPHKESIFYDTLLNLLRDTKLIVNRHVYISGYFVDIEITGGKNPIIVEYDENNHKYYDIDSEQRRESVLKQLGYSILRTDDSIPPAQAAARIYKDILGM